ncbi:MAG: hypothetical protein WBN35_08315 [Acidimicrobiia bacterium]
MSDHPSGDVPLGVVRRLTQLVRPDATFGGTVMTEVDRDHELARWIDRALSYTSALPLKQ